MLNQELAWARQRMPRVRQALAALPALTHVRLACSIHLELKMIPLVEALLDRGAKVFLVTCNPATVSNEVAEYLRTAGAKVEAWHDMSEADYRAAIEHVLEWQPTHFCEVGADLTAAFHQRERKLAPPSASLEATGSGITRLRDLQPLYPIYNWDDIPIKERLHNRHMVGLTTWHTFFSCTRLSLHEKRVVIIGYGLVGQGVAAAARAYGGTVMIVERDPARAIEAAYDGWAVLPLDQALADADVIVTATGATGVLGQAHFPLLKDGAFLLNVGHTAREIDVAALHDYPRSQVLPQVEAITIGPRTIFLIAGGAMVNLAAGLGDSLNSFDVTLAIMTRGLAYVVGSGSQAGPGLYDLPAKVWQQVLS